MIVSRRKRVERRIGASPWQFSQSMLLFLRICVMFAVAFFYNEQKHLINLPLFSLQDVLKSALDERQLAMMDSDSDSDSDEVVTHACAAALLTT